MSVNLEGTVVLITGASSGMGYEMAHELLEHGATVVLAARGGEKLDRALESLAERGLDAHAVAMDVTDATSIDAAFEWFKGSFDHLDLLVNNAGIGDNAPGMSDLPRDHRFYDIPLSTVEAVIQTNFIGFFAVTSAFAPLMVERGSGSIAYVSTSTSTMTRRGQLPYGPSKAGAEAMATIMAEELGEFGVAVNVICPGGFTDTGMAGVGVKEFFQKNNMRILEPTVLNKVALFLASSASAGISGEKLIGCEFDQWLSDKGIEFLE